MLFPGVYVGHGAVVKDSIIMSGAKIADGACVQYAIVSENATIGAHAVVGHGPHLLRPVEIYKNCPIFYSLGDFVIHNECIPYAPEEMYAKQNLTSDATMRELFYDRSKGYTKGLMRDHRMLESVIPYFEMEDGKLIYLELMPIELNFDKKEVWQKGNPVFSNKDGIIERLAQMSVSFGTKITIDDRGFGIVEL